MMQVFTLTFCLSIGIVLNIFAQISDGARDAITTLILSQPVSTKVFVDYDQKTLGEGLFRLKPGTYAFISPNSVFREVYIGIAQLLPYTTKTDGLLGTKRLYDDSTRGIYVTSSIVFELSVIFTKLHITESEAEISFFTTSLVKEEYYKDKYICVDSKLRRSNDAWNVVSLVVYHSDWFNYFGFDPRKKG